MVPVSSRERHQLGGRGAEVLSVVRVIPTQRITAAWLRASDAFLWPWTLRE